MKAGGAWAHDVHRVFLISGGTDILLAATTETRWGWVVGAGFEYAFAGNWSAKVEYNYMDFRTERVSFSPPVPPYDIEQRVHLLKVGINYRFGGWPVAAKF